MNNSGLKAFAGFMVTTWLAFASAMVYVGCYYEPPVSRVTVENCATACSQLRRLDCPEGKPTPRGSPCEDVCEANAELLEIVCVTGAASVADVRLCNVRCRL